ncbi:MAG: hypothetical protein RLZZ28_1927 [Bacteroidota bacterium]|jgi:uncharacterized membrane protein
MKQYHIISRFAIYLLAVVMICFGVYHFLNAHELVVYVPPSVPGGIIWAHLLGAAFILAGISFITNRLVKLSGYVLAVLLFIFIFVFHLPNYLWAGDKEMQKLAMINILKDTALACFALHIAAGAHHQHLHLEESD